MPYIPRCETPSHADDPWHLRKLRRTEHMPKEALGHLHELSRKCQVVCAREPKPRNFEMLLDPAPEPSPTVLDPEEELTHLRTVEEEEESEQEQIEYSFSALDLGKILNEKCFEEYWVAQGMPGSCRWPPKKQENEEDQVNEKRKKKNQKKKAKRKTQGKRKNKKEAVDVKGKRRFGQMHVNRPDEGWPLGPGDLPELFRWPNEVAACLTEALSKNVDFQNI